jgi:hypothetical protein
VQSSIDELIPWVSRHEGLRTPFYDYFLARSSGKMSSEEDANIRSLWDRIVHEFTRRRLTVPSDRSAAVLGLASAVALRTGWQYLAGYWLPLTPQGLLWTADFDKTDTRRTGLSPSWSWLSITGLIFPSIPPSTGPCKNLAELSIGSGDDVSAVAATTKQPLQIEKRSTQSLVPLRLSSLMIRLGPPEEGGKPTRPEGWPSFDLFVPKGDMPDSFHASVFLLPLCLGTGHGRRDTSSRWIRGVLVSPSVAYPGTYERVGDLLSQASKAEDQAKMDPFYQMLCDETLRQEVILI